MKLIHYPIYEKIDIKTSFLKYFYLIFIKLNSLLIMKSLAVSIFILSCVTGNGQSLNGLDSLLSSLNNKDLYVAPIIRGVSIVVRKEKINQDSICAIRRDFMVGSLDEDIQQLAEKYSKKIVIEKLVALLQDPDRDLYANVLLYDLLENRKLGKLYSMKREEWINTGRKICDTQHWQDNTQKQIYIY